MRTKPDFIIRPSDVHDARRANRNTAGGKATLDPNDFHMMVYGLKTRPNVGDSVNVTLRLNDGTMVPVTAIVKK